MIHTLFAVLPASVDDPAAPSGGNRYDREVLRRLTLPGGPSSSTPFPVREERTPLPARDERTPLPVREERTHGGTDRPSADARTARESPRQPDRPSAGPRTARESPSRPDRPFEVRELLVSGDFPRPAAGARGALTEILAGIPDGAAVLLDGLIACGVPEILEPHAGRLRLVILVHLPLCDETGLSPEVARELRDLEGRALRLATAVIATSTPAARRVEELHDLTGVHAVPPGVDPAPPAVPSPTGHRLLMVASLTQRKGYHLLLQALQTITDLPWTCTITGAGHVLGELPTPVTLTLTAPTVPADSGASITPGTPGGLIHERRAARLGEDLDRFAATDWGTWRISRPERDGPAPDEGSVRFTGPLSGEALDAVYADADLFVLPSYAETYGMVVTEALARGLPVLATDVGGVPEALGGAGGGRPGRLIPPGDHDGLATALREWLTDPALRARWRARAAVRRESLTSWDETANRIRKILRALP